jgi:hypothetical protein
MVFFAIPRYRLPYSPFFAILQAVALWQLYKQYIQKKTLVEAKPLQVS